MHESRPPTNRDTIRFQLSALQPHMIRSIEKVRHQQWGIPGTNVISTWIISSCQCTTNLCVGADGGPVGRRMSYSTILCRGYDSLALLDGRRISVNERHDDGRGRLRGHFRIRGMMRGCYLYNPKACPTMTPLREARRRT